MHGGRDFASFFRDGALARSEEVCLANAKGSVSLRLAFDFSPKVSHLFTRLPKDGLPVLTLFSYGVSTVFASAPRSRASSVPARSVALGPPFAQQAPQAG